MATTSSVLQEWYSKIISRRVDLVGDYAGNELFVVEGDSLLLQCLSDPKLDFTQGFQLLHAVYCVENFLSNLKRRKCNYHVVFFNDHQSLCVPPSCPSSKHRSRYLLARWSIIRHLQRHVSAATGILIKEFDSYTSPAFLEYLDDVGAYFIMCHDGAFSAAEEAAEDARSLEPDDDASGSDSSSASDTDSEDSDSDSDVDMADSKAQAATKESWEAESDEDSDEVELLDDDDAASTAAVSSTLENSTHITDDQSTLIGDLDNWKLDDTPVEPSMRRKRALRGFIYWAISRDYNVALINDVQFKDTKVFSLVLEGSRRRTVEVPDEWHTMLTPAPEDLALTDFAPSVDALLDIVRSQPADWTDRDILTLAAVAHLLQSQELSPEQAALILLSTAATEGVPIAQRRFALPAKSGRAALLQLVIDTLHALSRHSALIDAIKPVTCRAADLIDGRMLLALVPADSKALLEYKDVSQKFQAYVEALKTVLKVKVSIPTQAAKPAKRGQQARPSLSVLLFENKVFNHHLAPVRLEINESDPPLNKTQRRIFKELSHWHNSKRPIVRRGDVEKLDKWALKRNQRFMAEMITYAASLTNASGKVLEPETIVAGPQTAASKKQSPSVDRGPKKESKADKPVKAGKKPGQGGQPSNTELAMQAAAAMAATRSGTRSANLNKAWDSKRKALETGSAEDRFVKTQQYLRSLSSEDQAILGPEVELFAIKALSDLWKAACEDGQKGNALGATIAVIWKIGLRLQRIPNGLPASMVEDLKSLLTHLDLPLLKLKANADDRKLPFSMLPGQPASVSRAKPAKNVEADYSVDLSSKEFQLMHCGPYFDRSIDAQVDPRVQGFQPDAWQRKVLDAIDADKSLFVVAPTSAGKTFISFYAMQQVLRASDNGIVVYVAPTKALVNQIAAEIQARFSKNYGKQAKSVWGIHTRDYRINNPQNCQCLVTVPHILQIMLLAPAHAEKKDSWSYRIKRIIFDEVHSIGQSEDGLIWEQLLLQASCPIIALSATVGNPQEFSDWLSSTQKAAGHDLVTVQHTTRYSDLRKFIYNAPDTFEFKGLPPCPAIHPPGLDGTPAFSFVHPVAGLTNRNRGVPDDLNLEARDCLILWKEMQKHQDPKFPVDDSLNPAKCLPDIIRKADVLAWEEKLKALLRTWAKDKKSPYSKVVEGLQPESTGTSDDSPLFQAQRSLSIDQDMLSSEKKLLTTTLPLLVDLHAKNALPAILFSFDRHVCESMAKSIMASLEESEAKYKETSTAFKRKMVEYEKYKKDQERAAARGKGASDKKTKKGRDENDDGGSKGDRLRDSADQESSSIASFDPTAPLDGFHFADIKKVGQSDIEEYQQQLRYRLGPEGEWLVVALARGIGVHHAGMNRKYRQLVELLFRAGYLRVVIATGTLALGINMPCKTVVFSGNSVFLTALNYRQCAGRAGRRGFDDLGNVVFQDLRYAKVQTLLSSRLPDLSGHFPITTSLILRLAILLDESKQSDFAVKSINAILSQPRLVLGGSEAKSAVLHHLRFSIDYLRRAQLLDVNGTPLGFAGLATHLYFTEASTWAFHALMKDGYFHRIAQSIGTKPKEVGNTLMLVLSHIFGRQQCKRADQEFYRQYIHRSSSKVFLPELPDDARKVLMKHNRETLEIFETYVRTYSDQYLSEDVDNSLPLTQMTIGGTAPVMPVKSKSQKGSDARAGPAAALPATTVRSPFVALSGFGDNDFASIGELCNSVRGKVFLEEAAIPYLPVYNKETDVPLNAYLYDFYKHGDRQALIRANKIKPGDVWFALNDFSLVLATIVTSLRNYMKLSPSQDGDLGDLMGTGEQLEERRDDIAGEQEEARRQAAVPVKGRPQREKVVESWEDAVDAEEMNSKSAKGKAGRSKADKSDDLDGDVDGSGLMNVLKAFEFVRAEFDTKFKAIWA